MKKVRLLTVAAFVFAIGSAFAPKAVESMGKKQAPNAFSNTVPCTVRIFCPGTGTKSCGYTSAGCQNPISKP